MDKISHRLGLIEFKWINHQLKYWYNEKTPTTNRENSN